MQQNIELSLQSVVQLEEIQGRAEDLSKQANVFKKQGGQLKKKMHWQNIKVGLFNTTRTIAISFNNSDNFLLQMRLILGALVIVVLGSIAGIISYFVIKSKVSESM
jgi:hypothetical protein